MPHTYKINAFQNQPEVDCHLEMMNTCSSAHKSQMLRKTQIWFSQWTLRSQYPADCFLFCGITWVPMYITSCTLAVKMQGCHSSVSCRCSVCTKLNKVKLQMPGFSSAVKNLRNVKGRHKANKAISNFFHHSQGPVVYCTVEMISNSNLPLGSLLLCMTLILIM